jgi:hypothetical protein
MNLQCDPQSGRNPVAMRFPPIAAKSLISLHYGSRNPVATWRNPVAAKSLKSQQSGFRQSVPPTYVGEGRPGFRASFPSLFCSTEEMSDACR